MRLGIHLGLTKPAYEPLRDHMIRVAERADQAGFAQTLEQMSTKGWACRFPPRVNESRA